MSLVNNDFKKETENKLAELKKVLPVLLLAPYTKIIFLAGSVAAGHPKPESDIDLVVVSKNGRVWLNKFFMEVLARIFKIKRTPSDRGGKICFNMFLSNANPLLPHRDQTAAECYKNLKPVWLSENEVKKFWEKNSWIKKFADVSSDSYHEAILLRSDLLRRSDLVRNSLEKILEVFCLAGVLEKISFALQAKYLKNKLARPGANQNPSDYDFFLGPNIIAYHFPVSNYAQALKSHVEKPRP